MKESYWLTRLFYLRGLGFIYFVMALILYYQGPDLIGPHGLTPIEGFVSRIVENGGSIWPTFKKYPSLLFYSSSNNTIVAMALSMGGLSFLLMLGYCNLPIILFLWTLQLSLVNGGGRFYSFGWETMMLEMTLLAGLFVHPWRLNLLSRKNWVPHYLAVVPLLWMTFRLMLGAGLIKVRGDTCWLDFTCMDYHYETQPNPHFLSWYFHHLPWWFHRVEIGLTHFYELIVPFFFLLIRPFRIVGGIIIVFFQITLISTGNLAFLNWQTIVLAFVAFDDRFLLRFVSQSTLEKLNGLIPKATGLFHQRLVYGALVVLLYLSYSPVKNMLSPQQRMNQSYDGLHIVNSYGLFGSITKKRYEVIISGTKSDKFSNTTQWLEYEFHCKPGAVERAPCWITPYHLRLDWQMWFSAMRPNIQEEWLVNLAKKMLENHDSLNRLISFNPFAEKEAPAYVKMDLYLYEFTQGEDESGHWWTRQYVKSYMRPISLKDFPSR